MRKDFSPSFMLIVLTGGNHDLPFAVETVVSRVVCPLFVREKNWQETSRGYAAIFLISSLAFGSSSASFAVLYRSSASVAAFLHLGSF